MKRYKPKMFRENPVTKEISMFEDYRIKHPELGEDHIRITMEENPDGEWVKWEDVKDAIPIWESAINMNPFQFANLIQALTKGKIKCEGRIDRKGSYGLRWGENEEDELKNKRVI